MSVADAVLEIVPDTYLQFTLTSDDPTPSCSLELRHPDPKSAPIAFKVKTTQPRRYLVRPNQGLIQPGESKKVQILLVEKDKDTLYQSFQRLGQSALDNSKDKFLVQSVAILDTSLVTELGEYERLTSLWATVGGATGAGPGTPGTTSSVANKKLHVRHLGIADENARSAPTAAAAATTTTTASREPVESLSQPQLKSELENLRRKYDELVAFSVNLTAERDMLHNTLEQAKRDLNRQVARTAASDNARGGGGKAPGQTRGGGGVGMVFLIIVAVVMLALGIKVQQMGLVPESLPVLGSADSTMNSMNDEL